MTDIGHHPRDIYLEPGDFWFGGGMVRVRTLLGSCVSVTLWHPRRRIGGMCHFLLPERFPAGHGELCGKYGKEAFLMMDEAIRRTRTRPGEYQAKVFGGGNMFPRENDPVQGYVGRRNIDIARQLLARRGMHVLVQHVGGCGHRKLVFEVWSGNVWVKFQDLQPVPGIQ